MFAIPLISGVPIPSLFGATLIVPGAGAFIAMVLIAALVGSALGLLRQATGPHTGTEALHPTIVPPSVDHDGHHGHREAA